MSTSDTYVSSNGEEGLLVFATNWGRDEFAVYFFSFETLQASHMVDVPYPDTLQRTYATCDTVARIDQSLFFTSVDAGSSVYKLDLTGSPLEWTESKGLGTNERVCQHRMAKIPAKYFPPCKAEQRGRKDKH